MIIEMIPTIVQADIGSSSSKRFFASESTESVHAVIEVYIDHRFADLDRTLDESTAVVERCVTEGKRSTVDPLRIISQRPPEHHSGYGGLTTTTGSLLCSVTPVGRNTLA